MKNLVLILSLVMLSATISSAGHKGWSWGWWMPKPPKQERPEKPEDRSRSWRTRRSRNRRRGNYWPGKHSRVFPAES